MTKRKSSPIGRGAGGHRGEVVSEPKRPVGKVKPIISTQKHGKPMPHFHDTDETIFLEMAAIRRGCLWFGAIMAVICLFLFCGAVVAQGQPNTEFRSMFQIRRAMPDTVQLIHVGYNLRVTQAGVECVPLNPAYGVEPAIPVQLWIQGDAGEWIGVTKSGGTITLRGEGEGQYLEITGGGQTIFYYYMVPGVLTLQVEPQN